MAAMSATARRPRPRTEQRSTGRLGDLIFTGAARGSGSLVIAPVTLIGVFLVAQAIPALLKDQASFLTSREWTVAGDAPRFGIAELAWTTVSASIIAMAIAVPVGVAVALFITTYAPSWLRGPAATMVDMLAAVPPSSTACGRCCPSARSSGRSRTSSSSAWAAYRCSPRRE